MLLPSPAGPACSTIPRADLARYADLGRQSLWFFARYLLGFDLLSTDLHWAVARVLEGPARFKLIELPRQHLKTTLCTISYPLWRLIRDPGLRVLLVSATATNAEKWILQLARLVLETPLLRACYPELVPADTNKVVWRANALELPRPRHWPEASLEAIGVGGGAVSRHYDLIVEDDLVNEDQLEADGRVDPIQMRKIIDWHKRVEGLFVDPAKSEEVLVGNRWGFNDVISYAETAEPWFVNYRRAAKEHGAPIWPERFSLAELDRILARQGPAIFSCQYMNNPVADDARTFHPDWIRRFATPPARALRAYTAVDPSITQNRWSDFTAIVTVAIDSESTLYVLDARRGRWGVDEFIDQLFEVAAAYRPVRVGIEDRGFQRVLMYPIREAMRRDRVTLPIHPLTVPQQQKDLRIKGLHEYFNNGSLWLREGLRDLESELLSWLPGDRAGHDDLLDALAMCVLYLCRPAAAGKTSDDNPLLLDNILLDLKQRRRGGDPIWTWHRPAPSPGPLLTRRT